MLHSSHPPRKGGLGDKAINTGQPLWITDPAQNHDDLELRRSNRKVYDEEGIHTMVAIPLLVEPFHKRATTPFLENNVSRSGQGVVYAVFGEEPDLRDVKNKKVHHFTQEEIRRLRLFAKSAADAIFQESKIDLY